VFLVVVTSSGMAVSENFGMLVFCDYKMQLKSDQLFGIVKFLEDILLFFVSYHTLMLRSLAIVC